MTDYGANEFKHYGILRKSGRYPWGSGGDEYQRSMDFYAYTNALSAKGLTDKEIAIGIGLATPDQRKFTVADLRDTRTIAHETKVYHETKTIEKLSKKGMSPKAISEQTGLPLSTVRLRIKNKDKRNESSLRRTAEMLREAVDKFNIVDIGLGVAVRLGLTPERLRAAASVLRDEEYETYTIKKRQPGGRHMTSYLVMVPPGTGFAKAMKMSDDIHVIGGYTENNGKTFFGIHFPMSISSKRLAIKYAEDGGAAEDGHIYVRPGAKDLDMGKNNYAQVRILVDGTHYLKGMAILKDDLPDGVDLLFATNKSREKGKMEVLKPVQRDPQTGEIDPDNPFGAMIKRQIVDRDPKTGEERLKSAMNMVYEEGDWDQWSRALPSQVLSKQPHSFIESQLGVTRENARQRLAEIESITNPVVRKKKFEDFAEQIDADAVELRAAQMPGQRTHVLIGVPGMKKDQVYTPNFENGEKVVLIRYPHGGPFEIPEVTVNNNNRAAKKLLGNATDAVGVHPEVAARLSGADFDGDTVAVIPNKAGLVKGVNSLGTAKTYYEKELGSFDPKDEYGGYKVIGTKKKRDGTEEEVGNFKLMKDTGKQMGVITNLITDMSIQGAKPEHIVRAVRHSMVVIDAEKHQLDWKRSEEQNGIRQLKELYQSTVRPDGSVKVGGASTLLSRATAGVRRPETKPRLAGDGGPIDPETGAAVRVPTGKMRSVYDRKTRTYTEQKVLKEEEVPALSTTNDAYDLVRDRRDPVERLYADHANEMKSIANQARLKAHRTPDPRVNPEAKKVYAAERDKLAADLKVAQAQKPLDRKADAIAGVTIKAKRQGDPTLATDPDRLKKVERQAKMEARQRLGLETPKIEITDRQWDAIQSGAVSKDLLTKILKYADPDRIEELSLPRKNTVMTSAVTARAKAMLAAGATNAEVAASLGISVDTLKSAAARGDL